MSIDFSKFDKQVDLEGLKNDINEAEKNGGSGNFREVPHGTYEVKIKKLELTESKKHDPMVTCWFEILSGEYKGQLLFMNQVVTQGFQIHIVKDFLASLDSGEDISFDSYSQFADLLLDVAEKCEGTGFVLDYGEKKGYNTFKIDEVFDIE